MPPTQRSIARVFPFRPVLLEQPLGGAVAKRPLFVVHWHWQGVVRRFQATSGNPLAVGETSHKAAWLQQR